MHSFRKGKRNTNQSAANASNRQQQTEERLQSKTALSRQANYLLSHNANINEGGGDDAEGKASDVEAGNTSDNMMIDTKGTQQQQNQKKGDQTYNFRLITYMSDVSWSCTEDEEAVHDGSETYDEEETCQYDYDDDEDDCDKHTLAETTLTSYPPSMGTTLETYPVPPRRTVMKGITRAPHRRQHNHRLGMKPRGAIRNAAVSTASSNSSLACSSGNCGSSSGCASSDDGDIEQAIPHPKIGTNGTFASTVPPKQTKIKNNMSGSSSKETKPDSETDGTTLTEDVKSHSGADSGDTIAAATAAATALVAKGKYALIAMVVFLTILVVILVIAVLVVTILTFTHPAAASHGEATAAITNATTSFLSHSP